MENLSEGKKKVYYSYVWFPENLKENARERKYKGKEKVKENKKID